MIISFHWEWNRRRRRRRQSFNAVRKQLSIEGKSAMRFALFIIIIIQCVFIYSNAKYI